MKKPTTPRLYSLCKRGEGSKISSAGRRYFEVLKCVNDVTLSRNYVMLPGTIRITFGSMKSIHNLKWKKMKTQKTNKFATGIFSIILLASLVFLSTSCAQKVTFLSSSVVPAAKGTVKVKQDNNKNYNIEVEIQDLAEVERLQSSKQTYVVWMETDRGNTENLGQLKSSDSFFSKQKTASLETVSSYKPIKIFVTAENGIDVRYPGNQIILTTNNF